MFWKRPPLRPLRLLGVAMFVITLIITIVPESPTPWPGPVSSRLVALGDVLGFGP
jgi:hypothetical protein